MLYTLFLIDDGNSTLVLASALLSFVALIAIATACALGVWVWRLRHKKNPPEESVSDDSEAKQNRESCMNDEVKEHKETGSAAPSRTGSINCLLDK